MRRGCNVCNVSSNQNVKINKNVPKKDESGQNEILADYAVALNDKSKLETENALLKLTLQDQMDKIIKLTGDLETCKTQLSQNSTELKKMQEKHKNETELQEKLLTTHNELAKKLRSDIHSLKGELAKKHSKLSHVSEDLEVYKDKSKSYKEKLKCSLSLLQALNSASYNKKTVICNKGSQTYGNNTVDSCRPVKYDEIEVELDEQILSELFYKENPFMDSPLS